VELFVSVWPLLHKQVRREGRKMREEKRRGGGGKM
jgi:hypothetical protein